MPLPRTTSHRIEHDGGIYTVSVHKDADDGIPGKGDGLAYVLALEGPAGRRLVRLSLIEDLLHQLELDRGKFSAVSDRILGYCVNLARAEIADIVAHNSSTEYYEIVMRTNHYQKMENLLRV